MIIDAFQSIKDDIQRSLFYCLTFILTTTLMFIFFQVACSPYIGMSFINSRNNIVTYLSVFIIFICLLSVFFANDFYVKKKAKGLAIRLVCGATFGQLTTYLLSQTMVLFFVSIPFSIGLSCLFLGLISSVLPVSMPLTQEGIIVTVVMLVCEIFWCTILNVGYAYRSSIVMLIQGDRVQNKTKIGFPFRLNLQLKKGLSLCLFILPIIFIYIYGYETSSIMVFSVIGIIGIYQCIQKIIIPYMKQWIQKRLSKSMQLVYLGFLRRDIIFMKGHIVLLITSSILLLGLFVMGIENTVYQILLYVSFIAMNCLLSLTILFHFSTEIVNRQKSFLTLRRIGYEDAHIKKVIQKEIILFYGLILSIGLFYMINILISLRIHDFIDMKIMIFMIGGFCFPLITCGFFNNRQYQKQIDQ